MNNRQRNHFYLLLLSAMFVNCTGSTDQGIDSIAPLIQVISPEQDQSYIGGWGGDWGGDDITLSAKATDDVKIASIGILVLDGSGNVLLEKTYVNKTGNDVEFTISELYNAEDTDVVNTVETITFTATDSSGNTTVSETIGIFVQPLNQ